MATSPHLAEWDLQLCAEPTGIPTRPLGQRTHKDALGNPMYANEIYDPLTRGTIAASGLGYAMPFRTTWFP